MVRQLYVEAFFEKVKILKQGQQCSHFEHRIWNWDETGFCLGASTKKVLARNGVRIVHDAKGDAGRTHITVDCRLATNSSIPVHPFQTQVCLSRMATMVVFQVHSMVCQTQDGWKKIIPRPGSRKAFS